MAETPNHMMTVTVSPLLARSIAARAKRHKQTRAACVEYLLQVGLRWDPREAARTRADSQTPERRRAIARAAGLVSGQRRRRASVPDA